MCLLWRKRLAEVMSRLLELAVRLAVEVQERASSDFDFDGRPMERLSDVELLQILARGQGMTETKFMRIARGRLPQDSLLSDESTATMTQSA